MNYEEAIEWIDGVRSTTNHIPQDPLETWQVRVAEADANMMKMAYYVLKAHKENLVPQPKGQPE